MGYYINPKDMGKEEWLHLNGEAIQEEQAAKHDAGEKLVVCLVNNYAFTAAGIAYDNRERDAFVRPDGRDKKWFLVDKEKLEPYM